MALEAYGYRVSKRPRKIHEELEKYTYKKEGDTYQQEDRQEDSHDLLDPNHVPVFLYNNVGYEIDGEGKLTAEERKVLGFIKVNFQIPANFDKKEEFGPLSGISSQQRLLAAYEHQLLKPTAPGKTFDDLQICRTCGDRGHLPDDCPDGFEV